MIKKLLGGLFSSRPRAPEPGPVLPFPRYGDTVRLYGAGKHQPAIEAAVVAAGHQLAVGEHTGDEMRATLVSPGPREPITVWLDGQVAGQLFNDDVERVRKRMMNGGRREGTRVVADVPTRIYLKEPGKYGQWSVLLHV